MTVEERLEDAITALERIADNDVGVVLERIAAALEELVKLQTYAAGRRCEW